MRKISWFVLMGTESGKNIVQLLNNGTSIKFIKVWHLKIYNEIQPESGQTMWSSYRNCPLWLAFAPIKSQGEHRIVPIVETTKSVAFIVTKTQPSSGGGGVKV